MSTEPPGLFLPPDNRKHNAHRNLVHNLVHTCIRIGSKRQQSLKCPTVLEAP
jgi:hypothetical protein